MERAPERGVRVARRVLGATLIPTLTAAVIAGVFGALIGSFLNVVIYRVPQGKSLVRPGSACPRCGAAIRPLDNVPVLSWIILRARCRSCRAGISVRYPLVELATVGAFASVVYLFRADPWAWPAWFLLSAACIALALIDVDVMRLPSVIVLPSYPVGAALLALAIALGERALFDGVRAIIGMAALWGLYALLATVKRGGMGWGDVRLAGVLGLYLGWMGVGSLVVGGFAAFLLGGLWGIGVIVARGGSSKSRIPFGPWMIIGAAVGVAWGEGLWEAYLSLVL